MNIKMIVTDLDNTLLRRDKTVSDYTRGVLASCQESGILFVHATSRSIAASQQFADMTRPDIRITCGGALATSADTELYRAAFTQNETTHLLRSFAAEPNVSQITMVSETSYYTSLELTAESVSKGFYNSICIPRDEMADRIVEPALKLTIDCLNMSALRAACNQVDDVVLTRFSDETWIAVAKIGAQKHLALTAVIEQLGIAPCEVAVFGDDYNDIDMLSLPDVVNVAVENAIDEVKAVASQVCGDCDDDGIAKWIEDNVFGVRTIVVIPWQAKWVTEFAKIKNELDAVLSDIIISIEHVGSTSVVGLAAKPIIDIDIVIEESKFKTVNERLSSIGYNHNGDQGVPKREAFKYTGKDHLTKHHLYVCSKDSPELHRHLALRDCLRQNPDLRDKYSKIKFEMAEKYPHDINAYINGKGDVVREIYRVWDEQKGKK